MKPYLANLTNRERLIVIIGLLLGGSLLGYVLVVEPFRASLENHRRAIPARENDLAWMRQAAREIMYLRQASNISGTKATPAPAPLSVIDSSAKTHGLAGSLKKVEPEGEHKVRIWLEEALFDDIVQWLSLLERSYNIKAGEVMAEGLDRSGYVDARITLVQKSSS